MILCLHGNLISWERKRVTGAGTVWDREDEKQKKKWKNSEDVYGMWEEHSHASDSAHMFFFLFFIQDFYTIDEKKDKVKFLPLLSRRKFSSNTSISLFWFDDN